MLNIQKETQSIKYDLAGLNQRESEGRGIIPGERSRKISAVRRVESAGVLETVRQSLAGLRSCAQRLTV